MNSDPQRITLVCGQPPLTVTALRGQTPPIPAARGIGWNLVARPHRKALTEWDGIEPYQMQLSLLFDGVGKDASVEAACATLERMGQPPAARQEPPIVRVVGVVPRPELSYVVASFDWDTSPIWSRSGYRIRQAVTVHLLEYVADDRLAQTPAAERARQAAAAAAATAARAGGGAAATTSKSYVVKAGDTLTGIAARLLGAAKRWPEIATLNGIRDPASIKPGQKLRLP